jgi:hypothetical protein
MCLHPLRLYAISISRSVFATLAIFSQNYEKASTNTTAMRPGRLALAAACWAPVIASHCPSTLQSSGTRLPSVPEFPPYYIIQSCSDETVISTAAGVHLSPMLRSTMTTATRPVQPAMVHTSSTTPTTEGATAKTTKTRSGRPITPRQL